MRKRVPLVTLAGLLIVFSLGFGQEKFNDVRQRMADRLTAVKTAVEKGDRTEARRNFEEAQRIWQAEVTPLITEGVKTSSQFQEYSDRMAEVEGNLASLGRELGSGEAKDIDARVNAIIWGISHHPRGFKVPPPRYTAWDWVFGLGIGLGFCVFAVVFGLHLRKSYYRRYASPLKNQKG